MGMSDGISDRDVLLGQLRARSNKTVTPQANIGEDGESESGSFDAEKQLAINLATALKVSIPKITPENIAGVTSKLQFLAKRLPEELRAEIYSGVSNEDTGNSAVNSRSSNRVSSFRDSPSDNGLSFLGEESSILDDEYNNTGYSYSQRQRSSWNIGQA